MAAVLLFGIVLLPQSRVETLPEFSPPFVEVQTEALGLSALEVEQLITVPLEADLLNGVAFVQDIRSQSVPGLSSIVMTFEPGTDIFDARQLVQERLTQAAGLPNVSRAPAMVQPLSSESRVMMVGITSDELSLVDLGVLARWTIRPTLMGVTGVANVAVWGQREQQLQVQVDLDRLAEEDVPLRNVIRTAGNALWVTPLTFLEASTPGVGGFIDGPNQRIGIRHVPAITQPEDLAAVAVEERPDLVIGDLATVVQDHQPLIGDAVVGDRAGLYLIVEKFPWSNTAETTTAVEEALDELRPGLGGVDVDAELFRPASYLERAVDNIQLSAVFSLLLVVLAIQLLLGSWRTTVATVVSMLVAIMAAGLVLFAADVTINTMILAGLAIGSLLIVDDTVRNVAEMQRRLASGESRIRGIEDNARSFGYAAIVMVLAAAPSLFMQGTAGEFVPTVGLAMALAFVAAFVVAIMVTPAIASVVLSAPPRHAAESQVVGSTTMQHLGRGYRRVLDRATQSPRGVAIGGTLILLIIGAATAPILNREFVPRFRQTDLVVSFDGAAGTSLGENRRVMGEVAQELANLPGVDRAGAHVGRAVLSDEVTNVNTGEVWLTIDPSADYDATFDEVRAVVDGYPGFGRPTINTYANDRIAATLQDPGDDLVVRVYGEDPQQLTEVSGQLVGVVSNTDGVESARVLLPQLEPSVEIEVDLDRAAEAQVKPGEVRRTAAAAFAGIEVGSLFEDQKVFEVVVWSEPDHRNSVTSVENLLIETPEGRVPLSSLADVTIAPNERIIERDGVSRFVDIVADVPDRDVSDVQADIKSVIDGRGLPYEFHVGFIDNKTEASANFRQVLAIGFTAAVTIFLLLQAALTTWRLAAVMTVATVAGTSGAFVAILLAGGTYSIGSMAGIAVSAGLTLRAGLSLYRRYESLQLDQVAALGPSMIRSGASDHFAPTITSLVAIAAATLPFVVLGADAGREVLRPLAIAVLGGSISAGLVAVLVLPPLHLWLASPATPPDELFQKETEAGAAHDGHPAELATT